MDCEETSNSSEDAHTHMHCQLDLFTGISSVRPQSERWLGWCQVAWSGACTTLIYGSDCPCHTENQRFLHSSSQHKQKIIMSVFIITQYVSVIAWVFEKRLSIFISDIYYSRY